MCIIVAKKSGVNIPKKAILKNCFTNNPDGAGFMYSLHNKTIIKKGYTDFETFYNDLMQAQKIHNLYNKNVVLHFRIATSGGKTPAKTHPFILTNNEAALNSIDIQANAPGIAHNGVLSQFTYNKLLSDTQNYIKDFLYNIYKVNKHFYNNKYINAIINQSLNTSKLAIIDGAKLITYGKFTEEDGILYSNDTYKQKYYTYYNADAWCDAEYYKNFYKNYYKSFGKKYNEEDFDEWY